MDRACEGRQGLNTQRLADFKAVLHRLGICTECCQPYRIEPETDGPFASCGCAGATEWTGDPPLYAALIDLERSVRAFLLRMEGRGWNTRFPNKPTPALIEDMRRCLAAIPERGDPLNLPADRSKLIERAIEADDGAVSGGNLIDWLQGIHPVPATRESENLPLGCCNGCGKILSAGELDNLGVCIGCYTKNEG